VAKVNKSQAARLAGKNRQTIKNWIKAGRLAVEKDAQGNEVIDTSELMRCFGQLVDLPNKKERDTRHMSDLIDELTTIKTELARVETELSNRDQLLTTKDRMIDQLEVTVERERGEKDMLFKLLPAPEDTGKKSWWPFGKAA